MKAFDKASLALVPDGIKDGKLYSIKPTDGSGDFTFDRGSNLAATRVDENGLIEKGRENMVLYSNKFDEVWGQSSLNATSGQAGYDGTTDAWSISKTAQFGRLQQTVGLIGLTTMSVYAKASTNDWIAMRHSADGSSIANFDLTNGVFGALGSNVVATNSVSVGNGWYRISVTWKYTGSSDVRIHPNASDNIGGTIATILVQDVQVEQGLTATDYIETGATTAQAGILENLPRIDYTSGTPSLLMEPSRTNLIDHSEYLKGNTEFKVLSSSVTFVDYTETSPEGNPNALRILEASGTGNHNWYYDNLGTFVNGTTYTFSFFVKSIGGRNIRFDEATLGMDVQGIIDLSDGSILQDVHSNVSVESYGNGWYRVSAVGTMNGTVQRIIFNTTDGTTTSFAGDTTKGVSLWGVQIEQASYPTSYIPTYGAAATRGVDNLIGSTAFNGGNAFSIYLEMGPIEGSDGILLMQTNPLDFYFRWTSSSTLNIWNQDNNSTLRNIPGHRNQNNKILMVYDGSGGNLVFLNGTKYTGANYTWPSEDYSLKVGSQVGIFGSPAANSKTFKSILVFPEALSDADCIRLTTENLTLTKPAFVGGAGLNNFVVAVSGDIAGGSGTIETNWQWQISNDGNTWADVNGATNDYYTIPNNTNLLGKYIRVEQSINDEYGTLTVVASDGQQILQLAGLFDSVAGTAGYSLNRLRSSTPFAAAARVTRDGTHFTTIGFTSDNLFDSAAAMAYATQTGNIAQYYFDEEFNINTFSRYGGEIDVLATPFRGEENVLVYEVANDAVDDQRFFSKNILDPTLSHTIRVQAKVLLPSNQKVDKVRIWTGYSGEIFDEVTTTDVWVDVDQTLVVASGTNLRVQAYIDTNSHFYAPGDKFYIKDLIITDTTPNLHIQTLYDQSGNNNHAIQNAFQSMPKIIEDGVLVEDNGNPALKFDGVDDWLDAGLLSSQFSQVFVVKNTTGTGTTIGYSGAVSLQSAVYNTQNDDITFSSGSGLYTIDNLNVKGYLNGVDETGAATTFTQTFNRLYLGSVNGTYSFIDGKIQEYIHFPYASDQSKIREGIERVMANRYNIDLS